MASKPVSRRWVGIASASLTCVLLQGSPWLVTAAVAANDTASRTMYRWRDRDGHLRTGDSVPPEYATQDAEILNSRGVVIGLREGARSPAQRAEVKHRQAVAAAATEAVTVQHQRDQNLLATYLTVREINELRDRRLDLIEGQIRVSTQYLESLRSRLAGLEASAHNFSPYNGRTTGPALPPGLAEDLVRTMNDVQTQERNLTTKRLEFTRVRDAFSRDIARFQALKRVESDYGPGGYLRMPPENPTPMRAETPPR